jgi:hypothetical protein
MAYRLELNAEETGAPGAMFLLKASHGYREQSEVKHTVDINISKLYASAIDNANKDKKQLVKSANKRIELLE